MGPHLAARLGGGAGLEELDQAAVLAGPGARVAAVVLDRVAVALGLVPQALEDLEQGRRAGRGVEDVVELGVGGEGPQVVAGEGVGLHRVDELAHVVELVRAELAVGHLGGLDVEQQPDAVEVVQLVEAELGDLGGAVRASTTRRSASSRRSASRMGMTLVPNCSARRSSGSGAPASSWPVRIAVRRLSTMNSPAVA